MSNSCKYCFVRTCSTNSKRNPDKYFFRVPYNREIRTAWCHAVGRDPKSLSYASAAFCCSSHFDMDKDLNRIASTSVVPVLNSDVVPSLEYTDNQKTTVQDDNVPGIPGDNAPKNVFVREVVYIEENYDDRFLEESNDVEDTLSTEPDCQANGSIDKDVIEILDDESPAEPSSSNKTTVMMGTTMGTVMPLPKNIVHYQNKKKFPIHYAPLKDMPNKPLILRQIKQLNSFGKQKFIPISNLKPIQRPVRIDLNHAKVQVLPETTTSRNSVSKPAIASTLASGHSANQMVTPRTYTVNRSKYMNVNEFGQSGKDRNAKRSGPQSDDDDDCVLVEEENMLNNNNKEVKTTSNQNSSKKFLTLPASLSIKPVFCAESMRTSQPLKLVIAKDIQTPTISSNALVPVQSTLRMREFTSTIDKPIVSQNKIFTLIKLMISENQLLLGRNTNNLVKIARTKPNEFTIMDNVYYYRTNDEFENNYFFMNITRQPRHSSEIIQRSYGIYWGNPRRNCVGVVETKGLDDQTKDFVFQQVKESLFNVNGQLNTNPRHKIKPASLVLHNLPSDGRFPTNRLVGTKPIKVKVQTKPPDHATANPDPVVVSLDDGNQKLQPSHALQPRSIKRIAVQGPIPNRSATSKAIKKIVVQSPVSKHTATSKTALSVFPTRPVIKKLTSPVEAPSPKIPSPRAKPKEKLPKALAGNDANAKYELIRLSQFLTPTIRKLINKLKYFELNNGKVFAVKVGDSISKDKPFNIVFTENKLIAGIQARPVSKLLYVSKLVNYLFSVTYPYMKDRRCVGSIPIPQPPDIISDATPEVMEALLISESRRTYKEIAKLEASVNNSNTAQPTSEYKHRCHICYQAFQRKYQLQRHQFMAHNSKPRKVSATETSTSSTSNVLSAIADNIRNAFQELANESCSSDAPLMTTIKTEEPEEASPETDPSLLVPLYEELVNEARKQIPADLSSVKQEPEVHFEETSMDNVSEMSSRDTTKIKQENDDENGDETDSAPECLESLTDAVPTTVSRELTFEEYLALERQTKEKEKRNEKVNRNQQNRKIKRSRRSRIVDNRKTVTVMPMKISKAKELIKQWPSLTVDLFDVGKSSKFSIL